MLVTQLLANVNVLLEFMNNTVNITTVSVNNTIINVSALTDGNCNMLPEHGHFNY